MTLPEHFICLSINDKMDEINRFESKKIQLVKREQLMKWAIIAWELRMFIGDSWRDEILTQIYEFIVFNDKDSDKVINHNTMKSLGEKTSEKAIHFITELLLAAVTKMLSVISPILDKELRHLIEDDRTTLTIDKVRQKHDLFVIKLIEL